VNITFWGTRGSIAAPGPDTVGFGGDTSCVAVVGEDPTHLLILDAGTGIRGLGLAIGPEVRRIDLLLSHLHLDHIVGLGFFEPLFRSDLTVTIWAPPSTALLHQRLGRYLSPPLFPVRVRDLGCQLELREGMDGPVRRGQFVLAGAPIIHPDIAFGYRISCAGRTIAYLPDHEPALGPAFPTEPEWTSGAEIAQDVDLLIHDGQYGADEYLEHIGWGHSSVVDAAAFATLTRARRLVLFHHDPGHDDEAVSRLVEDARAAAGIPVSAARQDETITL
jgi:phosphoribosyl 1,2-cyclic phosphodiesterase